ncbi:hypothetical protein LOAG_11970 [Loa loa]|uniref:Uncharacterized protein n=1 Tax=Loa loa TaxID=7209 RepID=A0A1S0TNL2_LOALO|nr:hypothetical protein LOAG_11970 [Loa loa]EFO16537.1 hypothetical protein LOAG_11970 [Loa loa]
MITVCTTELRNYCRQIAPVLMMTLTAVTIIPILLCKAKKNMTKGRKGIVDLFNANSIINEYRLIRVYSLSRIFRNRKNFSTFLKQAEGRSDECKLKHQIICDPFIFQY